MTFIDIDVRLVVGIGYLVAIAFQMAVDPNFPRYNSCARAC